MSRIVIDVSGEQHQKIKTLAALNGQSIKDFVLDKVLERNSSSDEQAWDDLKKVLVDRIQSAEKGELSGKTMLEITDEKVREMETK